jgi:hypothetical protein
MGVAVGGTTWTASPPRQLLVSLAWVCLALSSVRLGADEPSPPARAATTSPTLVELPRAAQAPTIDGRLDDPVWQAAPLDLGVWQTFSPTPGLEMAQATDVWVAYDDKALYFAFLAHDTEPKKVRSHLGRRDDIYQDDTVGVAIDSLGTAQLQYEMYVNADGVQMDIVTTHATGSTNEPDWFWESAGRRVPEGFAVEIKLPWTSIRFRTGSVVEMGMIFWRNISRLGQGGSWPTMPPGCSQFEIQAPVVLRDLKPARPLELVPSFTYGWSEDRVSAASFGPRDSRPDAGLSAKVGLGTHATLDLTVNPDFSQVESDAYQIETNQRYPLFFTEKRPFFMEGMTAFQLAGAGPDATMRTAVHTRRIVDPDWGAKLTGGAGPFTFVTLHAADRLPPDDDALPERVRYVNIGRLQAGFGQHGNAGLLITSTVRGRDFNHVAALDLGLQGRRQTFDLAALASHSRGPTGGASSAFAGHARYAYRGRRYGLTVFGERYDPGFRMDTAFLKQVDVTDAWATASLKTYPRWGTRIGLQRVLGYLYGQAGRDREQGGNRRTAEAGMQLNFTRNGWMMLSAALEREPWAHQEFPTRRLSASGQAQLTQWLNVRGTVGVGRSVLYDPTSPSLGDSFTSSAQVSLQPTGNLNVAVGHDRSTFDDTATGARVYTVNVVNAQTTYQFDRRSALRAIVRYDSSLAQILTDYLASYELAPGSVAYLGYGSLYERHEWESEVGAPPAPPRYLAARRGLFFKISYAHRF